MTSSPENVVTSDLAVNSRVREGASSALGHDPGAALPHWRLGPAADDPGRVALDLVPVDPHFVDQYHLVNGASGQRDLHLVDGTSNVWDDYSGAGVRVAVLDDGVDYLHPDLLPNYDFELQVAGVDGFHPDPDGAHGTAVAGIIAAQRNDTAAVGIAYDATLVSMPGIPASDLSGNGMQMGPTIALDRAFENHANYDVINNSWGFVTAFYDSAFNDWQASLHTALEGAVTFGRGGLGSVIVKSAGNGRGSLDNTAGSWTTASWDTIAVAAVERDGDVTSYSTEGASVLVSAFGGPASGDVVTTDRTGGLGYSRGIVGDEVTERFNGTSAAAPMVSGIVALMLEANPDLGYRDVQAILAATARHTGADSFDTGILTGNERYAWDWNGADDWNGGAMHFSEDYGFGLVDALAAVRLAETWSATRTAANRAVIEDVAANEASVTIADLSTVTMTFTVSGDITVEQVGVSLDLSHDWMSDLEIQLVSPDGTVSELMRDNFGSASVFDYGAQDMTLVSNAFRGEMSAGTWQLVITDDYASDSGTASHATITLLGRDDSDDTYVFTEEFSDYADDPSRRILADADGGTDTINAAAVFSDGVIDLTPGASGRIDGVVVTVAEDAAIENAVGGDGDDRLTGHDGANRLTGGRGDDVLDGGAGADTMVGGDGNDVFVVETLDDVVVEAAGGGVDTVRTSVNLTLPDNVERMMLSGTAWLATGSEADNTLLGSGQGNRLLGLGGRDYIVGYAGDDTLDGGAGRDTLLGGRGDDVYLVSQTNDIVREDAGNGWDTVVSTADYTLGAHVERLELRGGAREGTGNGAANALIGSDGDDRLVGLGGRDYMCGEAGDDTLDGGAGTDTMVGGTGSDVYIVGLRSDVVVETPGEGYDTVVSYASTYALPDGVERLECRSTARVGYGNDLRNTLMGSVQDNFLYGEGGEDRVYGHGGNDTLVGGVGDDTLVGGSGADIFILGEGEDVAVIGPGDTGFGFALRDKIADFVSGEDRIDLSGVDAQLDVAGRQTLDFAGEAATPGAGEITCKTYGATMIVSLNLDADAAIEMQLQLNDVSHLGAADFIL